MGDAVAKEAHVTLVVDGWENKMKAPVLSSCVVLGKSRVTFLVNTTLMSTERHTASWLAGTQEG